MFIAVLLVTVTTWKLPTWPSTAHYNDINCGMFTQYKTIQQWEWIQLHTTVCLNLTNITLCERQKKGNVFMVSFKWSLKIFKINLWPRIQDDNYLWWGLMTERKPEGVLEKLVMLFLIWLLVRDTCLFVKPNMCLYI